MDVPVKMRGAMRIVAYKPGHDGCVAILDGNRLELSIEAEKDSFPRHEPMTVSALLRTAEVIGGAPDVVALGGWYKGVPGNQVLGAGYRDPNAVHVRQSSFFGRRVPLFTSSHERSHIMAAIGMAPPTNSDRQAVLVWEGSIGSFYVVHRDGTVERTIPVLKQPGSRYSFLYGLADPTFPDAGLFPRLEDSGKLMAVAAFGEGMDVDPDVAGTIEEILALESVHPAPKHRFRASPIYNAGVEAAVTKAGAAYLTTRLFEVFADVAVAEIPKGLPLRIAGGCGLNCNWNHAWRDLGHFASVFVPPCPDDSGSAIGTAIDALRHFTGNHQIEWSVYSGLPFEWDIEPPESWMSSPADLDAIASTLAAGAIIPWIHGRWEIGPRALGNRSILASAVHSDMQQRLNALKGREGFRPIAPVCRNEDTGRYFEEAFEDPYMLYTRKVRVETLPAVTHADRSARLQTVTIDSNRPLYDLLTAVERRTGVGVICNTSLNFRGCGFINRMSDLVAFCDGGALDHMVVDGVWLQRRGQAGSAGR
jgi:hydroxymethyl cephem carbamoyltransferase